MACGNASRKKPRDAQGHVDARAAQLLERDRLQAGHAARGVVPDRADAQQREGLGDVVAGGAHRAGAPQGQADGGGPFAVVGAVALQEGVGEGLAGLPGEAGRDGLGVDGVEVAAGRQDVDQAAQRGAGGARAGRSRRSGRAGCGRSRRWCAARRGTTSRAAKSRMAATCSTPGAARRSAVTGRPGPSPRPPSPGPGRGPAPPPRRRVGAGRRGLVQAERLAQARQRGACRPRSGGRAGWPGRG